MENVFVMIPQTEMFDVVSRILFQWDPVSQDYHGQLFKVNISYTIEKQNNGSNYSIQKNDCFVFKSSGSVTGEIFRNFSHFVDFPTVVHILFVALKISCFYM